MIQVVDADLFDVDVDIIAHQVNCMGVMGSGVAAQVKALYPDAYVRYRTVCREIRPQNLLGMTQTVSIKQYGEEHERPFAIANLFAQLSYGRDRRHTDYAALVSSLKELAREMHRRGYQTVAVPYMMGCVRGGGDWNEVLHYLETELKDFNVFVCKKDKG